MMRSRFLALAAAVLAAAPAAQANAQKEQFVPATFHWVGPYVPGGGGIAAGMLDYFKLLNARDGGVHGVKFTWRIKENGATENGATGATLVHPLSTGINHSLIEKGGSDRRPVVSIGYGRADAAYGRVFANVFPLITTYWDQAAAIVRYLAGKEGGFDRLRARKIALVHHDSAYGREPIAVLTELAEKYGYQLSTIAVPHPGNEQQEQWLRIRQLRPDWVILWGWGAMNPAALKTAAKIGYPRTKIIGAWWSGAEEDVLPAGNAAEGFVAAGFSVAGTDFPVIRAIQKHVYAKGDGELEDRTRIGSVYYNRGVVSGIIAAEAVRVAQQRFGKGKPVTGAQVQWALEHLDLDSKRLRALGAEGFLPPLKTSCADHEGSGVVRFMRWNGARWNIISDWLPPAPEDAKLVRARYERSALKYAKDKGITPRTCP